MNYIEKQRSSYITKSVKEKTIDSEVIKLNLLKAYLKISNDAHNELLNELLAMSIEYAEWYMERALRKQAWKLVCIGNIPKLIFLPFGPLISVDKVNVCYSKESFKTLKEDEDYTVEEISGYIEFSNTLVNTKLEISYTSGYEKIDLIPANIKEAILKYVAYVYHQEKDEEKMRQIKKVYEKFKELKMVL